MSEKFIKLFGTSDDARVYFAPGRVNLIGEHIDYNGGHVFPCALTVGNYVIAKKRTDRKLRFFSINYKRGGVMTSSLDKLFYRKNDHWINYPKGVIWAFIEKGYKIDCGLDVLIYGNIPGSGLSSSAAVEVSIGVMLKDMFNLDVTMEEVALLSQKAENEFNGMNCGIMDQYASAMGKENQAMLLNCSDLSCKYVPVNLKGCKIVVTNSRKPHSLSSSHYNERREECNRALKDLQCELKIDNLCQLSVEEFEKYKHLIKDDICRQRAKHVVYEEQRTIDAIKALNDNDVEEFGRLLNESGDSLRYDYDATCFEIDTLVDESRKQKGVYGSRETGGGWGGNTVSIVSSACVDDFIKNVGKAYQRKTGLTASFFVLEIGDGARRLL